MQRYRVNYSLLIGIVVGSIVLMVGLYFLWQFQRDRNADRLITRAEEARDEGDLLRSIGYYSQYLGIRPGDEEVTAKFAGAYADLIEEPNIGRMEMAKAFAILEHTVSEQPENQEMRRRLVDLYMKLGGYKESLPHISQLLNQTPGDKELEEMRSRCLYAMRDPDKAIAHSYRMVGYDSQTDDFSTDKAVLPNEPSVYLRLAMLLKTEKQEESLARRVVDEMVEANPEDGNAYLYRAEYLRLAGEQEEADAATKEALEVDGDSPEVVRAYAFMLIRPDPTGVEGVSDSAYEEATQLLEKSLETNPESTILYQALAGIAARRGDVEAAKAWFDRGIENVSDQSKLSLRFYKAKMLLHTGDLDQSREELAILRESRGVRAVLLDYLDARMLAAENQWFQAAEAFEELRTALSGDVELTNELNFFLGLCYEKLSQFDKSLAAYDLALQADATNKMAAFGRSRVLEAQGRAGSGTASYTIYSALADELAKDEEDQDWERFDQLVKQYCDGLDLSEAMRLVLQGEVLMRRGLYPEARTKLLEAFKLAPNELGVRRAAVKLFASDPEQGPVNALKLLDKVVQDLGDMPILRLERADLLMAINDEDLTDQLFGLAENIDDWDRDKKVQLWKGLAAKFAQLRDSESRQACLVEVAKLSPNDLATLEDLFLVARQSEDQAGMKEVQEMILEVVGSKERAEWMFTEANRLVSLYKTQGNDEKLLEEADALVRRSLDSRPDWHLLHLLKAEIALRQQDADTALESFDRAAQLGRASATSAYQHVKLLMSRLRYRDAIRQMEKLNPEGRAILLGRDYTEALLQVGRYDDAVAAAEQVIEAAPNNAQAQRWYGQTLGKFARVTSFSDERREALLEQTGEALEKAVELDPTSSESWGALISYLATTNQAAEANDAVRRAQLVLPEDSNRLMYARCYEVLNRAIDAEERYLQAHEDATPQDLIRTKRLLAEYYLGRAYGRADRIERATPLINEILQEVADGDLDANDQHARWARNAAARIFASSGQYQDLRAAENLLSSNVVGGQLPTEERLLMAEILLRRPEPVSRIKAINLLEGLNQTGKLGLNSKTDLCKLYFSLDRWRECRELMTEIIAQHPDNPAVRQVYLGMLLERGGANDLTVAVRQLRRLVELAPNELSTRELAARVALERGRKQEANKALRSMLPGDLQKLTPEQVPIALRVAGLYSEFEEYEVAEGLYKLAAQKGGAAEKLELATFLGVHRDPAQGFAVLDQIASSANKVALVRTGIAILRDSEDAAGDEALEAKVEGWLEQGLREDPNFIALRLLNADYLDYQQKFDEAADEYRAILELPGLQGASRAVVLNNLSYNLALSDASGDDIKSAVRYISEAVDLLGPQSEVLDTRGVIAIADKRYNDAIQDLEFSVIDRPTASKYFHLALARMLAGQMDMASQAWQQAVDLGLTRDSVAVREREQYDQLKGRLEGAGLATIGP